MPSPVSNLKALQRRRETGENTFAAVQDSRVVLGNAQLHPRQVTGRVHDDESRVTSSEK